MTEHRTQEAVRLLAESQLFRGLDESALAGLASRAIRRHYDEDEVILVRGAESGSLGVIVSGRVKVTSVGDTGNEVLLDLVGRGQVFGELAVLDGEPRSADVIAIEPTEVLTITRTVLLAILREDPDIALHLLQVVCAKLRRTTQLLTETVFLELPGRLAHRIRLLATEYGKTTADGVRIEHGLSQQELADSVGASRERVNKQLRSWEQSGLLTIGRGLLLVPDLENLTGAVD